MIYHDLARYPHLVQKGGQTAGILPLLLKHLFFQIWLGCVSKWYLHLCNVLCQIQHIANMTDIYILNSVYPY